MAKKVLSEEQMREYVEQEVRNALLNENMDEGFLDKVLGMFGGNMGNGGIGGYLKDHMNLPDIINILIGILGVTPVAKWLCGTLGIDTSGPLAKLIITALSTMGTVAVGDAIQNRRNSPALGRGGETSQEGGSGFSGGGIGGGSR